MNTLDILRASANARTRIISHYPAAKPEKDSVSKVSHLLWMTYEIDELIKDTNNTEKVMRWLGFVQGTQWLLGLATIEQLKEDNREAPADVVKRHIEELRSKLSESDQEQIALLAGLLAFIGLFVDEYKVPKSVFHNYMHGVNDITKQYLTPAGIELSNILVNRVKEKLGGTDGT